LGISPKSSPALKQQFHHLLSLLSAHFAEGNKFLLGDRISVADFAFYGSFYAHIIRDPVPGFLVKTEAPLVADWIERIGVERLEQQETNISYVARGEDIPETLVSISRMLMEDFSHIFRNTLDSVLELLQHKARLASDDADVVIIPRHLKMNTFRLHLNGKVIAEEQRNIATHCIWMMQRILDRAYSMSARTAIQEALNRLAGNNTAIVELWKENIQLLENSGWHFERDSQNRLIARKTTLNTKL
jgi:hypothetical protein